MFLLDTCLVSEFTKPKPNPGVTDWIALQSEESLFLSVITIAEIVRGAELVRERSRRERLERWVQSDLLARFAGRLLPVDVEVARAWGRLQPRAPGPPLPVMDCLIAATAIVNQLTVVTRNTADLERCSAQALSPWI